MSDYRSEAESDARATVNEFRGEILNQLIDHDEASEDLGNDYPNGDSWHHETHVDRYYTLTEAAECIDELSQYEETDSGLWVSQQPKEAIGTCAAYTYGNAVYDMWVDLIKEINDEAEGVIIDYDNQISDAEEAETDKENENYEGPDSDDLRDKKRNALEELIDGITGN